jgi:hypothetical protein
MTHTWRTAWQGQDILVFRDEKEVDRLPSPAIERILFVYSGSGDSVGSLQYAVVEAGDDAVILPAETGFAGRVNFERLEYWASRSCIYWVPQSHARLPLRLRSGWLHLSGPAFARLPRRELQSVFERWPLEGPQTWEQRKWRRIEKRRPFAPSDAEERLRV